MIGQLFIAYDLRLLSEEPISSRIVCYINHPGLPDHYAKFML